MTETDNACSKLCTKTKSKMIVALVRLLILIAFKKEDRPKMHNPILQLRIFVFALNVKFEVCFIFNCKVTQIKWFSWSAYFYLKTKSGTNLPVM